MSERAETVQPGARPELEPLRERARHLADRFRGVLLRPFYSLYERHLEAELPEWRKPQHIGIIMDGNRRFARRRRQANPLYGHLKGADKLEEVLNWCEEAGVEVVSVWIFSLDNFHRAAQEVTGLMELFERKFLELVTHPRIHQNQIRVRFLGKTEFLPQGVQMALAEVEQATAHYTRRVLNVGVAYGGREEIVEAFRQHLRDQAAQGRSVEDICAVLAPEDIEPYLYTAHVPDPDLIIRTSGEIRLSGFLLWQSVYSEFYFCDSNWPDFRKIDFLRALRDYSRRKRRFGR